MPRTHRHRLMLLLWSPAAFGVICIAGLIPSPSCGQPLPVPLSPTMRYAPPDALFNAPNQLQLLQDEIDQKQFPAAVNRLDSLLADSSDLFLSQGDDASVLSVGAWVSNLPPRTKDLLRPAYEAAVGAAAQQAVEQAQARPDADPAEFAALARRYPLSRAATAALAEGARRSAALGDVPSTRWMLNAAITSGWLPDPTLAAAINSASVSSGSYSGPVPFDASWYGAKTRQGWAALRSFPVAAGNLFFVVGPEAVIALRPDGHVFWKGPVDNAPVPGRAPSAPVGVTRGPPFSAAVLRDAEGTPQILVARSPQLHAEGWALRAIRASDGHLLWTTEGQDDYRGLVFGSNPALSGRYVYAVAGEMSDQLDHLSMLAIELTTGKLLWRCDIGNESRTTVHPGIPMRNDVYRPWLNESAPAVAGDLVLAAPDVGAVLAVGRFDGKLRWTHGYPALPDPTFELQEQRRFALEHPTSIPPLASGLSQRWANTPAAAGDTVVAAPEDSDQVIAVSVHDGKPLWQSADFPEATLVGITKGVAIMAGRTITGVDAGNGKSNWTDADQTIVGPSVLYGDNVLVPTTTGIIALAAETGSPNSAAAGAPLFEPAIISETVRQMLRANDIAHCFGLPAALHSNER